MVKTLIIQGSIYNKQGINFLFGKYNEKEGTHILCGPNMYSDETRSSLVS